MDIKSQQTVYNTIILGPSSSGKTSIATYLADKYHGQRISLDGLTANGRPLNTVVSISNSTKFTKEELGVLIRRNMIKEASIITKQGRPWFIDDIDNFIYEILPKNLHNITKVIVVIPSLDKIISNVLKRNKEATVASEERHIIHVLRQLRLFVAPYPLKSTGVEKMVKANTKYIVSNLDLIKACEHDKMHYSIEDKKTWETNVNELLNRYGFKSLKNRKLQYVEFRAIDHGQHAVFLNNGTFLSLIKRIDNFIQVVHSFEQV